MTVLFALIAYVMFLRGSGWYEIPGAIALASLAGAVLYPRTLTSFERAVARGAHVIGAINSWIIFSLLYILIFVPVGAVLRVLGQDLLEEKYNAGTESYWRAAKHETTKESYERFF